MTGLKDSDIVCGRGGLANKHPGNRLLRRICNENRTLYQSSTNPIYKQCLILSILKAIGQNGGRFLTQSKKGWSEISAKKSKDKIAQLLRESEDSSAMSTAKKAIHALNTHSEISTRDHIQTPMMRQHSLISPEYEKELFIPCTVPSEDLSNLLQQPLLDDPPRLVEEETPVPSAAPMPMFNTNEEELFERIALEAIETEIASHGTTWSPSFARHAGIEYSAAAAL